MPWFDDQRWTLRALAAAGLAVGGAITYWKLTSDQRKETPKLVGGVVGKLKRIVLYPVKSTRGVEVQSVECLQRGFKYDRRWVVVNTASENTPEGAVGRFLNLARCPQLALIQTRLEEADGKVTLVLEADGRDAIRVPELDLDSGEQASVDIYSMQGQGMDCGDEVAAWLAELTGVPGARMYYMPETAKPRRIDEHPEWNDYGRPGQEVSFANFAPYVVASEQSLAELNSRLEQPVEMARFRPSIVVECSSPAPFQEDNWKNFSIGDVTFHLIRKCTRCSMITQDPNTGERVGPEPMKTLKEYRIDPIESHRFGGAPTFGTDVASDNDGVLRVGDDVVLR